jgi:hypothetical protein
MDAESCPTQQERMMAALAYGGLFLGVLPFVEREGDFATFHARHAAAVWAVGMPFFVVTSSIVGAVTFLTCGLGLFVVFPLLFPVPIWAMLVGIQGTVLALNGRREAPYGTFGLGDLLFANVRFRARG